MREAGRGVGRQSPGLLRTVPPLGDLWAQAEWPTVCVLVGGGRGRGDNQPLPCPPVSASGPWEGHMEGDVLGTGMGAPGQPTFKVGCLDHL